MMRSMSDQSPFGDDLELRLVRRPEGSRRSKSTGTPGAERDLLRDSTGALLGPTESFPVNTDDLKKALARSDPTRRGTHRQERSPGKQMAVEVVADVAYLVVREAVAQVRSVKADLPVIYTSADAGDEPPAGATVLSKPFALEELLKAIHAALLKG